jgi:Lrp/AsnC family leucine-responsive transcriptional regulator
MKSQTYDAHEIRMLDILQREGRKSVSELADAIGLSATPCARRLEGLRESGVITGFAAKIDRHALGLEVEVFVHVRLTTHADKSPEVFIQHIERMEPVVACWSLTGDHDFMLQVVLPHVDDLNDFIGGKLLRIPGIRDVKSNLVLKNIKGPGPLPLSHLRE